MPIQKWIVNIIKIHCIISYGIETLKHSYVGYFIAHLIQCCPIMRISSYTEIVNFQHTLFELLYNNISEASCSKHN